MFTTNTNKEALEFAYKMGLRREEKENEDLISDLDFAYAMGLRKNTNDIDAARIIRNNAGRSGRGVLRARFAR